MTIFKELVEMMARTKSILLTLHDQIGKFILRKKNVTNKTKN